MNPLARIHDGCPSGRPSRLFSVAVGLIALHILDDTLLQPPAGTTPADHLASGLIPFALLALGAAAYPRFRSGSQGLLACVVGVFGVTVGIEAAYYSLEIGPSGDDFTGLLALPAGLALMILGAATLWRGRRLDRSRPVRYGTRALLAVVAVVGAYVILFPVALGYLTTHIAGAGVPEPDLGAAYEDIAFTTKDGLELEGWYVPSRNGAAVIAFPGRGGPQRQTRMLVEHGYGVLLFDRRGEGTSEGAPNGFGWGGELDIEAAIAYLRSREDVDPNRIAGLGLSVGGELMLQVAAADEDGLNAVISDGAGARSWVEDSQEIHGSELIIGAPLLMMKTASVSLFSDTAPPPSLFDLIPQIAPTPLLLISSAEAPNEVLAPRYADLAGEGATHWAVPGNDHVGAVSSHPIQYERTLIKFLDAALAAIPGDLTG